jgi:multiple sugar transport system ATP-binding protein
MTMADKIVVLQGGKVEQIGTPLELYDRPRNVFVAGFLGSPAMNFLEGRLTGGPRPTLLLPTGTSVELLTAPPRADGRDVIIGIRPEDLSFATDDGVPAIVTVIEPTGSETHVALDVEGRELTWVMRERAELIPNQTVKLSFKSPNVHFFDKATQQRL